MKVAITAGFIVVYFGICIFLAVYYGPECTDENKTVQELTKTLNEMSDTLKAANETIVNGSKLTENQAVHIKNQEEFIASLLSR